MEYRQKKQDLKLPVINFDITNIINNKELIKILLQKCFEKGINNFCINACNLSDNSEGILTKVLEDLNVKREEIFITIKINVVNNKSNYKMFCKDYLNQILNKLNLDYIDIIIFEKIQEFDPVEEFCEFINSFIKEKKVKNWGVSNWNKGQIEESINFCKNFNLIPPCIVEIQYYLSKKIKFEYMELIKNYHFGIMAPFPLKKNILDGVNPKEITFKSDLDITKENFPRCKNEITRKLTEISEKKINCTVEQLEIAWSIKNANISIYLIGFTDIKQIEDIIRGIEIYKKLDDEICMEIKTILEEFQNEKNNISYISKNKIINNKSKFKGYIKIPSYIKKMIIIILIIIYSQKPLPLLNNSFAKIDKIRYGQIKKVYKNFFNNLPFYNHTHITNNTIYWCWLQGINFIPELYLSTLNSVKKNCKNFSIIILNESNIENYVRFPSYITKKYKNGYISPTHFSDLLRLELLIKYGGTWIDASVLITNFNETYFNNDLFFFQERTPGCVGSNWFITSEKASPMLLTTRDLLYEYWKNNDILHNYYIFHLFIAFASERYIEDLKNIPYVGNRKPHFLRNSLLESFSKKKYKEILQLSSVHKLSIKILFNKNITNDSFYFHIIDEFYPK